MKNLTGFHAVTSRLRQRPETVHEVYVDAERKDARVKDLRELAKRLNVRVIPVDSKRLDGMAGGVVAAMSIGWPVGSVISGRTLHRVGARPFVIAGGMLILVGSLATAQAPGVNSLAFATAACGVVGLGMGFSSTVLLIMVQGAVPWQRRATATGLVQFSRTIAGSAGVGASAMPTGKQCSTLKA